MKNKHHNVKDVKQQAMGKWHDILSHLCPNLTDALSKPGKHVDCTIHGGKKDFRLYRDYAQTGGGVCTCGNYNDGFDLLCAVNNCTLDEAVTDVADILGLTNGVPTVNLRSVTKPVIDPVVVAKKNQKIRNWLQTTWDKCTGMNHFRSIIALQYLAKRGLHLKALPAALRLHPSLQYIENDSGEKAGTFPTMVAQVKDSAGQPVTLHRTYLNYTGGKADVTDSKKLMAYPSDRSITGAAIRLFEAGRVLGLAEGIETALAVHEATAMPVWACISNTLLERVIVPDSVGLVVIWADNDRSGAGQKSAEALSIRLRDEGFQTIVMTPYGDIGDKKGLDWLDMLNRHGVESFFNDCANASLPNDFDVFESDAIEPLVLKEVVNGCA